MVCGKVGEGDEFGVVFMLIFIVDVGGVFIATASYCLGYIIEGVF